MLGIMEGKRTDWLAARWMESVTVAMGTPLEDMNDKVKDKIAMEKIYIVAKI